MDQEDIRRFCFDHTRHLHAELKRIHVMPGEVTAEDKTLVEPLVATQNDFLVLAAGGQAGAFSAYVPGWGGGWDIPERDPRDPTAVSTGQERKEEAWTTAIFNQRFNPKWRDLLLPGPKSISRGFPGACGGTKYPPPGCCQGRNPGKGARSRRPSDS